MDYAITGGQDELAPAKAGVELNYVESISDEMIRRVLNKNELKPWQNR